MKYSKLNVHLEFLELLTTSHCLHQQMQLAHLLTLESVWQDLSVVPAAATRC